MAPPYIELSLTKSTCDQTTCRSWAAPVRESADACLVLDVQGLVYATSPSCRSELGLPEEIDSQKRSLADGAVRLVTFSPNADALPRADVERVPPLQALNTGALARGLIRVLAGDVLRTLDAVSTPIHGGADVAGSLTFFRRC